LPGSTRQSETPQHSDGRIKSGHDELGLSRPIQVMRNLFQAIGAIFLGGGLRVHRSEF